MNDVTIEELVDSFNKAKGSIEEMEAQISIIKEAILDYLKRRKITGEKTKTGYFVRRVDAMSFTGVKLEHARELSATVNKESLDLNVLKKLHLRGIPIPGSKKFSYVRIDEAK